MPVMVAAMKAAQPEIGTRMMTGAAVESTMYESFAREMRCGSVIVRLTFPPTRLLKASSKKMTIPRMNGTSCAWKRVLTLVIAHSETAWSPPEMYMKDVSTPSSTTNARMYISSARAPSAIIRPPATSPTSETLARTFHPLYISAPSTTPIPSASRILLVAIAKPIVTTGGRRDRIDGSMRGDLLTVRRLASLTPSFSVCAKMLRRGYHLEHGALYQITST